MAIFVPFLERAKERLQPTPFLPTAEHTCVSPKAKIPLNVKNLVTLTKCKVNIANNNFQFIQSKYTVLKIRGGGG